MSPNMSGVRCMWTLPSGREGHKEMYVCFFLAQRHDLRWGAHLGDRVKNIKKLKKGMEIKKLSVLCTCESKYSTKCEFPDCDRGI